MPQTIHKIERVAVAIPAAPVVYDNEPGLGTDWWQQQEANRLQWSNTLYAVFVTFVFFSALWLNNEARKRRYEESHVLEPANQSIYKIGDVARAAIPIR